MTESGEQKKFEAEKTWKKGRRRSINKINSIPEIPEELNKNFPSTTRIQLFNKQLGGKEKEESVEDNVYSDRLEYWYPAIGFRKVDDVITPIRKKELDDRKSLSLVDKKLLYC
ncbi:unnamed protein product [Heligmosomoides polygyrus]|uniref:Uncharacterized protein n=1 Tax=Heligmosomoides polygyrus TaxID=6339 RepID=A0A183GKA3_HELPZ|nr:unnamed protein product [Heligmosomoides polygyrus]